MQHPTLLSDLIGGGVIATITALWITAGYKFGNHSHSEKGN